MKKADNTQNYGTVESFEVSRVRVIGKDKTVLFSLKLNGVDINNCRVVESKNGDFISLPQYKGTDGNYYSTVFFKFSQQDSDNILSEVERQIS